MKKSYPFDTLSETKRCRGPVPNCGKPLKKRIAEEHPKFERCYSCHVTSEGLRGHRMKGN